MLIASWNVNSIRSRQEQVMKWIEINNPDVLCLQETKVQDDLFPREIFEEKGYSIASYGQKSYNGVAIISKYPIDDIRKGFCSELNHNQSYLELDKQKRIISALINGIRIINVYVPNGSEINSEKYSYKINWIKKFKKYLESQEKRGESTCIAGDFNIAPEARDIYDPKKWGKNIMSSEEEILIFKDSISKRFKDSFRIFENATGFWSWWDYRNRSFELNRGWRIDHIYISTDLRNSITSAFIDKSPRGDIKPSDHAPIALNLELNNRLTTDDDDFFDIFT
mgnify:CR=1 FL=1|tara:strand:+ start:2490 stop:3332 length:843 start_codon:yes stop_codon:yes gene_type:complete